VAPLSWVDSMTATFVRRVRENDNCRVGCIKTSQQDLAPTGGQGKEQRKKQSQEKQKANKRWVSLLNVADPYERHRLLSALSLSVTLT